MDLLKGTSIYRDEYIGIREVIQNAIDASLLQMWEDITHNSYLRYKLSKDNAHEGLKLTDFTTEGRNAIFSNYDITVEVIKDLEIKRVLLVVKDKGIGISLEDIRYIADIGSSKENNIEVTSIPKKVFKPDSRYPHLVLPVIRIPSVWDEIFHLSWITVCLDIYCLLSA